MKIDKLKELSKAGTSGPWSSGVLTDDTIMHFICERSKALKFNQDDFLSISKKECDSDLVVSMRNNFDALLEVADAADKHARQFSFGSPSIIRIREALNKLEEI